MYRFIFCALALCSFAATRTQKESCADGQRHYRTTLRHIESGGIGYDEGYTTLEAFLASDPSQWKVTPFLDARGHVFNDGKWATNVGVGLRSLLNGRVYGLNAYYDYRHARRLNSNQIGIGLETLGEFFDFRVNGYSPFGTKISPAYNVTFSKFSGHRLLLSQKYNSAMKGGDAEIGFHFGKTKSLDFYAAVGPYYFKGKKSPSTWGGKARIAGVFKDFLTLEISDSYDRTFHNKFQGQLSLTYSFGPKSKIKQQGRSCQTANILNDRMLQPVGRQEIIVIDKIRKNVAAIDPATGLPYFFVFVNNKSHSEGTYESPYPTLVQAQDNSSPNNIIYVYPGDGTTRGMDSGITLKASQKFWGSGVSHSLLTTKGLISIPAQSSTLPTITNTNINTDGNAINLTTDNVIRGFIIDSVINDAIYGTDPRSLDVSSCKFINTATFPIEANFPSDASISITSNQFLNNVNGVSLTLNGTSTVVCSDNLFSGQTSVSNVPIEIAATSNTFSAKIKNNFFANNTTGSIRLALTDVAKAEINVAHNTFNNNGTGAQSSLGSNFVVIPSGVTAQCALALQENTFVGNTSNAFYLHTSGSFTTLTASATGNTMNNNGGSALVFATPVSNTLTLTAVNNTIMSASDNGIALISSGLTASGSVTISNNTIMSIGNSSNGIAINQDFTTLNLALLNNVIDSCEGTGILSYASNGIDTLSLNISGNSISNCQNTSSNAASGLDIEQYKNLTGSVANNSFSNNPSVAAAIGSTLPNPAVCFHLSDNSNTADYLLTNPAGGTFNLSPCDFNTVNTGTINTSGTIDAVSSCSNPIPCGP